MKQRKFRIKVENPCQQDWDKMPKTYDGIYCGQCSKVIHDFTSLSDEELMRVLTHKTSNEICGKFHKIQLEKTYFQQAPASQNQNYSLPLLIAGLLSVPLFSQSQSAIQKSSQIKSAADNKIKKTHAHEKFLKGKVIDRKTRSGIEAQLFLYSNLNGTDLIDTIKSDNNGHYLILLPDNRLEKFFRVVFKSDNFHERNLIIDRDNLPIHLAVSLLLDVASENNEPIKNSETIGNNSTQENTGAILLDTYSFSGGVPRLTEEINILYPPGPRSVWNRICYFFMRPSHKLR